MLGESQTKKKQGISITTFHKHKRLNKEQSKSCKEMKICYSGVDIKQCENILVLMDKSSSPVLHEQRRGLHSEHVIVVESDIIVEDGGISLIVTRKICHASATSCYQQRYQLARIHRVHLRNMLQNTSL